MSNVLVSTVWPVGISTGLSLSFASEFSIEIPSEVLKIVANGSTGVSSPKKLLLLAIFSRFSGNPPSLSSCKSSDRMSNVLVSAVWPVGISTGLSLSLASKFSIGIPSEVLKIVANGLTGVPSPQELLLPAIFCSFSGYPPSLSSCNSSKAPSLNSMDPAFSPPQ